MYRYYLATRYLLSRPINLLGVGGILLGVWALIVVPSIFTGYLEEVGKHLQSSTADLTVRRIPDDLRYAELASILEADAAVVATAPRLTWQGMLHPERTPTRSRPPARGLDELADTPLITILGIDPTREMEVTGLADWLAAPTAELRVADLHQPLSQRDELPVMLPSQQRLTRDGLSIGGTAVVSIGRLVQENGQDSLRTEEPIRFRIGGTYESSFSAFDGLHVLAAIDELRHLLDLGADAVNEIAVRLRPGSDPEATAARLRRALESLSSRSGNLPSVATWRETNAMQLGSIDHQRGLMKLVLFVIMIVAAFLIYATLSMMVTEKTRDIGILTAMGADTRGVVMVFIGCGAAITVVGVLLGVIVGCLSAIWLDPFNTWLQNWFGVDLFPVRIYNLRHVPHSLDATWILQIAAVSLVIGVVVAALPAWRAARHDPLVSLRNES